MRKSFKEATGFDLVWKNFANHLHNLKLWYDCYRRLRKFTGISVDHSTGIITMDQEWWDARIQVGILLYILIILFYRFRTSTY